MKSEFILIVVLVASAAGGGYWLGKHQAHPAPDSAANQFVSQSAGNAKNAPHLPPVHNPLAKTTSKSTSHPAQFTLADIEAKLLELKKNGPTGMGYDNQMEWMKMLADVDVADIPQLLAFVDKNLSRQMQWGLRYQLLQRWAGADVSAAMAYANQLTNRQERETAIGIVAAAWTKQDSAAAIAWLKQLPRNRFRDQILNSILTPLSQTDPQSALDLAQSLDGMNSQRWGWGVPSIFATWAAKDPLTAAAKA